MTRESIIEQVNAILAEEFEIDQDLFYTGCQCKGNTLVGQPQSCGSCSHYPAYLQDQNSRNRFTEDSDLQQSL